MCKKIQAICPQTVVRRKSDAGWVTLFLYQNKYFFQLNPDLRGLELGQELRHDGSKK